MVLCSICARSLTAVQTNQDYEQAWGLLDRQLEAIAYMGIDDFLEEGQTDGDIENVDMTYHWNVETKLTDIENLYEVNVTVLWKRANRERVISAKTMLLGAEENLFVRE